VRLSTNAEQLGAQVRAYQQTIVGSIGDPLAASSAGDQLYAALVEPIARWITPGARVVIVPDPLLSTLNFETLPVPGARRHYWIEDVEIAVAPSLGIVSRPPSSPPSAAAEARSTKTAGDRSVLLIGDAVQADRRYPALRYASAEMSAISSAFSPRASVYRAAEATPARYLDSQPERFDIVHFTAHADANVDSPLDSAVILSPGERGYKLYARDVADHQLTADLVTISACRSAGERAYAGEGLVGFAWAFLRAGAKRVMAGLWDVDDRSTADLMGRVYGRLAAGASPGTALRAEKLAMIKSGGAAAKPYYWGPFQLFVGSRVIP
jgi:CHAT domain-containing protein